MDDPNVPKEIIFFHGAFVHYITPNDATAQPQDQSRTSTSLRKLAGFSEPHLRELSADMYDELQRRLTPERARAGPLAPRSDIHWKRNDARRHVGSLPETRFRDICRDLVTEQERRYTDLKTGPTYPLQDAMFMSDLTLRMSTPRRRSAATVASTTPNSSTANVAANTSTGSAGSAAANATAGDDEKSSTYTIPSDTSSTTSTSHPQSALSREQVVIQSVNESNITPKKVRVVERDSDAESDDESEYEEFTGDETGNGPTSAPERVLDGLGDESRTSSAVRRSPSESSQSSVYASAQGSIQGSAHGSLRGSSHDISHHEQPPTQQQTQQQQQQTQTHAHVHAHAHQPSETGSEEMSKKPSKKASQLSWREFDSEKLRMSMESAQQERSADASSISSGSSSARNSRASKSSKTSSGRTRSNADSNTTSADQPRSSTATRVSAVSSSTSAPSEYSERSEEDLPPPLRVSFSSQHPKKLGDEIEDDEEDEDDTNKNNDGDDTGDEATLNSVERPPLNSPLNGTYPLSPPQSESSGKTRGPSQVLQQPHPVEPIVMKEVPPLSAARASSRSASGESGGNVAQHQTPGATGGSISGGGAGGAASELEPPVIHAEASDSELRKTLEEQTRVTQQVRREAAQFLEEMRALTQQHEEQIVRANSLDAEVRHWKERHAKLSKELEKSQEVRIETAIKQPGLADPLPAELISEEGNVRESQLRAFLSAISVLVAAVHNGERSETLLHLLHRVVLSAREITTENSLVIRAIKQLISVVRNYTVSSGLFPRILVDAACSDVTTAVIEYSGDAKVVRDDPAAAKQAAQIREAMQSRDASKEQAAKLEKEKSEQEQQRQREIRERELLERQKLEDELKKERLEREKLEKEKVERAEREKIERAEREEREKQEQERREKERIEKEILEKERTEQEKLEKEKLEKEKLEKEKLEKEKLEKEKLEKEKLEKEKLEQERLEKEKLEQVKSAEISQTGSARNSEEPEGRASWRPRQGPEMPLDESVKSLQTYLEEQTSGTVDAIGALLSGIKSNAIAGELKPLVERIRNPVDDMIKATEDTMAITRSLVLKNKGSFIVQNLRDCMHRMAMLKEEELDAIRDDARPNRHLKQRLAGVSFDVAKSTKELVKTVEEVVLQTELGHIDQRLT